MTPVVIISGAKMVTEILSITVSETGIEVMNGPHMEPSGEETPERGSSRDLKMLVQPRPKVEKIGLVGRDDQASTSSGLS